MGDYREVTQSRLEINHGSIGRQVGLKRTPWSRHFWNYLVSPLDVGTSTLASLSVFVPGETPSQSTLESQGC